MTLTQKPRPPEAVQTTTAQKLNQPQNTETKLPKNERPNILTTHNPPPLPQTHLPNAPPQRPPKNPPHNLPPQTLPPAQVRAPPPPALRPRAQRRLPRRHVRRGPRRGSRGGVGGRRAGTLVFLLFLCFSCPRVVSRCVGAVVLMCLGGRD